MNKSANLKKNYLFNLIVVILEAILPLITTPLLSRILEPSGIGIYSYTYSLITMFTLTGALGTATHAQRMIAINCENKEEYSKIFWEIFIVRTFFLTLSLVIFIITTRSIGIYVNYFYLQIPYFIGAMLDITWLYQGLENFRSIAIKNVAFKILGIGLIFILIKTKDDLWIYLFILSLSQCIGNLSLWFKLKKYILKVSIHSLCIKRHFKEILLYFIPTIAYQLYSLVNKIILGALSTSEETGFYEQAQKIVNLCVSFLSAYNVVIRSRMSFLYTKNNHDLIILNIRNSVKFVSMLSIPIAFGISGIASDFVPWFFGNSYEKVIYLLMIFAPIIMVISVRTCLGATIFTPFGLQAKANIAQCSAALVNCSITAILIPWLQSYGAVISSLIAESIILFIYFILCKKYITIIDVIKMTYKYFIAAILMTAVVWLIGFYLDGVTSTILQIVVGTMTYFLILVVLCDSFVYNIVRKCCLRIFYKQKEDNT